MVLGSGNYMGHIVDFYKFVLGVIPWILVGWDAETEEFKRFSMRCLAFSCGGRAGPSRGGIGGAGALTP